MKPNLIGSEYASQPEDISGYSTAGFKNLSQTSRVEPSSFNYGNQIEGQTWRYPPENKQNYRQGAINQAQVNPYAAENQIKFQGDLGDDMLPPYTDDDESQDERGQQSPKLDLQGRRIIGYGKNNDETPSINSYKQALNLNSSNNISQQSQKNQNKNFMTFNEISELELSGSQIQINDGQSDRMPKDGYYENNRMPQ